jgi:two-component system LytT family response regulator
VVFLDVQMPGMDGFEVARALPGAGRCRVVFVTAHDQYALQAFEVHALDYLLKPSDRPRFTRVLDHVRRELKRGAAGSASGCDGALNRVLEEMERRRHVPGRLLIEEGERAFLLPMETIDWVEADRNDVCLHVGGRVHVVRGTLEALATRLDPARFVRLSRSHLVRIDFIDQLERWFHGEYKVTLRDGRSLTWTRRFLDRNPGVSRASSRRGRG